jgi:hypothetical protein
LLVDTAIGSYWATDQLVNAELLAGDASSGPGQNGNEKARLTWPVMEGFSIAIRS